MRDDIDIPLPAMSPGGATGTSYRVPRPRETVDPNTKRLAIIAAAIAGVIVVFAGAASFMGSKRAGVPVVEADPKPIRTKPADAGGMQVAGKDEAIMSGKAEGQPALAPQTEAPAPAALKAALTQPAPVQAAAPAVAPNPAAASIASALPPVTPAAPAVVEKPAPAAVARTAPVETKQQPKQATATPAITPAPAPAQAAKPATSALAMAHPQAAPATAPAPHVAPAAAGSVKGPMIQLAAVGSEQAAQAEWARLTKKFPEVLGTRKPVFSKVERDGRTFWRIRTAGFPDANAAKGACDKLRAQGAPGCTVSAS